jgi:hypothetical protein
MRLLPLTVCAFALSFAETCVNAQAAAPAPAPAIGILLPTNNATVTSPVTVRFRLVNYGVAPAGMPMERTGHFHLLIDDVAGAPGTVIPADSLHLHFGKGQIEVTVPMPLGKHTLRAVLGDYQHKVIGPELVSDPVTIRVVAGR